MARSRVELFEQIRRDGRIEELSIRELASRQGVHRRTVRQALANAVPPPRKGYPGRSRPAMDPWVEVIDSWLLGDLGVPRKQVTDAEAELVAAERALPQLLAAHTSPARKNAALPGLHRRIHAAAESLAQAKTSLRAIPAKVAATDLDPNAQRARPRIARRGLQMVLRLLAFNTEAWLAGRFNAYLADPNEYRAILRNLLHHGGHVDYTRKQITITLDRPDSPRVAGALQLLTDELNNTPARLPGDRRPLTYQVTPA